MYSLDETLQQRLRERARLAGMDEEAMLASLLNEALSKESQGHSLYISAPVNALVEGLYREDTTIADILQQGDFGIGTFNDLDGEMVVCDGVVYQLRADGQAYAVSPDTRTPFACVTFFTPYSEEEIQGPLDYPELLALFDRMLPSHNMLYAIRVTGEFDYVRTRSVPRQEAYRPLVEVAREQPEFEFAQVKGTLVGFWTPQFMESVAVPGYHLHFITADKQHGGHLLNCRPRRVRIAIQHIPQLQLGLPMTLDYLTADLTRDTHDDLQEAEH